MRDVPTTISDTWKTGIFIGDRKPVARITVQHPTMKKRNWTLMSTYTEKVTEASIESITDGDFTNAGAFIDFTHGHPVHQAYYDFMFTPNQRLTVGIPRELPNIKSVSWTRNIDQDVADCSIEMWNTKPLAIGEVPLAHDLDYPGYYSYNRGASKFASRWGHTMNEFFGMLMPDNIIRTYEGYGFDPSVVPELDTNLVQTGVWMIDSVSLTATGTISIKCRDLGRILLDQYYFTGVVPPAWIDQDWQSWDDKFTIAPTTTKLKVTPESSSNRPWLNGADTLNGHTLAAAFDGHPNTYWLSIGNIAPSRRFAYEWVQAKVANQSVSQVNVKGKKSGYTCYISVMVGGQWQGTPGINYHRDGIGQNGGNIPYVAKANVDSEGVIKIRLPKTYKKVQRVRITFGNLQYFNVGTYKYRAGIRDISVFGPGKGSTRTLTKGPAGSNPGRYDDYTDIIKLLLAWGGWFWPKGGRLRISDATGTRKIVEPGSYDTSVLGKGVRGRIWGDLMQTGTHGIADLASSEFAKKTLMDCINVIKENLGFLFFIDEVGGAQWRFPNIENRGCVRTTISTNPGYLPQFAHEVSEDKVLMSLSSTLDYSNVREFNFVGDYAGKVGAAQPGWNPNNTGLRRWGIWTDANYAPASDSKKDVKDAIKAANITAELLGLRQLFTYRLDKITIPANPAIQIDDQIRIWERVTSEGYIHYVQGISSQLDMDQGQWTYDLDTHWLGYDPKSSWIYKNTDLHPDTQEYIDFQHRIKVAFKGVDRHVSASDLAAADPASGGD